MPEEYKMSMLSLQFMFFFVAVLVVYYVLPGKFQWVWLLLAGLFFYFYNATIEQIASFLFVLGANYLASLFLQKGNERRILAYRTVLIFDIAVLFAFKYSPFRSEISRFEPLHLSFFLLIVIGYITDVYWDKCDVQKNFGKMILFSAFFPQLTSGPIVRYNTMESQLWGNRHGFSYDTVVRGIERILLGVFKKLVVSARCAVIVDTIYGQYDVYSGIYVLYGTIMYAMQLYTDFSGLMDIALGVSECLGIILPENFNTPFFSKSIAEFWRRWHITLGAFLKDYVLFSIQRGKWYGKLRGACKKYLGKDYKKKYNIPAYISLLISWFLIGLWHGGEWKYVFGVGIYMWFIIVASELLSPFFEIIPRLLNINTDCFSYDLFRQTRTFFLYIFGLSFFRADSLTQGFYIWKSAFSSWNPWILFDGSLYELGLDRTEMGILVFGLGLILVISMIAEKEQSDIRDWLSKQNYVFRITVFAVLFVCVVAWGYYGPDYNPADFVYGSF